ncbi:DUF3313 domain-containing protein [Geomonas sp. RF6]|uniref:DUF3313 domain-containing protein n=1 Tax=Geomonas sp. RF6 TaxID=2897342 RepID=UPI001E3C92F4|nr:DUF3313 domain-containing protein [Geomonas sp. RF6]UFS70648.1 DUF3313 domain-containing protein [Geomonas sp. RF6]
MKRAFSVGMLLLVAASALQLAGCGGSYQARKVDVERATLVNPSMLQKGEKDQALFRYVNPKADPKKYTKIMIDPVIVTKDGELDAKEMQNYQTLANNAYVYLREELGQDFQIVTQPEPGTMRVQMAISDADSSKPVRNTLSTVMPIGMGLSAVKYAATGKQSGVGEITSEMKITDATTGELLGAALDRRVGGKTLTKLWSSWYNADEALKYWAKRLRFVMCDMRGTGNCTPVD